MILKIFLISSFCLIFFESQSQESKSINLKNIVVEDFFDKQHKLLFNNDSCYIIIFVNHNSCSKCIEIINNQVDIVRREKPSINIIYLIRVGRDFYAKSAMLEKLTAKKSTIKSQYFFDIENDKGVGIEDKDDIKGNFKLFDIDRTPALIIVKKSIYTVLSYEQLFDSNAELKLSIEKLL